MIAFRGYPVLRPLIVLEKELKGQEKEGPCF
jgi:hypothetical protein